MDEFLRPLAQALPSHIRYTTDFIIRLKNLGRVPENSILTILDVSSLYTNIDTDDGLAIIEEELTKTKKTNFANVYMDRFQDTFVYRTEWYHYIIDWVRFIDDIFFIWKGDERSLTTFIKYLNGVESSIKFTHEKSYKSLNFLDTKVIKDAQGNISTDIFRIPTHTYTGLWRTHRI